MYRTIRLTIFMSLLLAFSLLCTSCSPASIIPRGADSGTPDTPHSDIQDFDTFSQSLFRSLAASDPLTLNYTLSHPENYGIHNLPDGFSSFTYDSLKKETISYENLLAALKTFDPEKLTHSQQILYEILEDKFSLQLEERKYLSLSESLGPTTGIQAQLPVLLAEFRIEDASDLSQYFSLLRTLPRYFSSLLSVEEKKKQLGTLPCRSTLTHIINQCESYLNDQGTSILVSTFTRKIAQADFLTEKERQKAIRKNKELIQKSVIPAYESLLGGLTDLLPFAGTDGALCHYKDGLSYYKYLVRAVTGSSRSVTELTEQMQAELERSHKALLSYAEKDPALFRTCQDYTGKFTRPEQILDTLKEKTTADFPACRATTSYTVKKVDESLQDYLSPAFYLTPPLDDTDSNVIYINGADRYDPSSLFNTLAHEGYPGHLLQTCYAADKKFPILRYLFDYGGYTEGWASYAEIYSYKYTGQSEDEVGILQNNMTATLCLYGLADTGVHYKGWTVQELSDFLKPYGTFETSSVEDLYNAIVDEPASYLKYTVGYLEFTFLKEKFRQKAGENYTDKAFHTYVLDMGPASFDILRKHLPGN